MVAKTKKEKVGSDVNFPEHQIKHLELIQDVVNRLASGSFQMKGWMITIVSALLAIYADNENELYPLFAILPTVIFWFLDAYYLWQERKFRGLYNDVSGVTQNNKVQPFAMPVHLYTGNKYNFWRVLFSVTIWPLYVPVIIILFVLYQYL